jgi:glycerol-3-phosphate acyltransferase PlsY
VIAGASAVLGHVYPVWLGFRGGKGVATASGVFAILSPWPAVFAAVSFVIAVWRTRFVSLGSILATIALPIVEWLTPGPRSIDVAATGVAALILFRHRGNIARLWTQTERALGA